MFCPKCGHKNPDDAAFCMKCGVAMNPGTGGPTAAPQSPAGAVHPPDWLKAAAGGASASPRPAGPAPAPVQMPGGPHASQLQPEQQVWTGSASWKSLVTLGWGFGFLLPLPLIIYAFSMRAHFEPRSLWSLSLLSLIPIGVFLFRVGMLKTTSFRVTNERISVLKGLLSRESDDVQLMRVADVQFFQSLINRLLNVGDVRVLSSDKTVPDLVIPGVESPAAFKEMLWNLVRERRRNMVAMEQLNQGFTVPLGP